MLILSRHAGEVIHIGNARVTVLSIGPRSVKLGIEAPRETPVHRGEIHEALQRHYRELFGPGEGEKTA